MPIKIEVILDDHGVVQNTKVVNQALKETEKAGEAAGKGVDKTSASLGMLKSALAALGIGLTIRELKDLGVGVVNTAGDFERLRITLDTITKGKGDEWFEKINAWALRMPISTQAGIDAFIRLNAMGLKPTIEQMQILVDTTSALGGQADTLNGIVLAMGQIATKNKLMSQEIRQLAERGIPAYEILMEKLGITGEELEKMGSKAISSDQALQALWEGMAERFGGQSEKIREAHIGIIIEIKSQWQEFQRIVMDTGPFEVVKDALKSIRDTITDMNRVIKVNSRQDAAIKQYQNDLGYGMQNPGYDEMIAGVGFSTNSGLSRDQQMDALKRYDFLQKSDEKTKQSQDKLKQIQDKRANFLREYRAKEEKINTVRSRYAGAAPAFPSLIPETESPMSIEDMEKEFKTQSNLQQKYADELRTIQFRGKELQIQLTTEGWEQKKELLRNQFEEEFGMLDENDDRRKAAMDNLQSELFLIERDATADRLDAQRDAVARWSELWGGMLINAQRAHGNFAQNVIEQTKSMFIQMAIMSATYGVINLLTGGAGGFMGGAISGFRSMLPSAPSAGKAIGSVYNDYSGMNFNISSSERAVMAGESDSQLAARLRRIVRDGHLTGLGAA